MRTGGAVLVPGPSVSPEEVSPGSPSPLLGASGQQPGPQGMWGGAKGQDTLDRGLLCSCPCGRMVHPNTGAEQGPRVQQQMGLTGLRNDCHRPQAWLPRPLTCKCVSVAWAASLVPALSSELPFCPFSVPKQLKVKSLTCRLWVACGSVIP